MTNDELAATQFLTYKFPVSLLKLIPDEPSLTKYITAGFAACAETCDFTGEEIQIILDDDLIFQEVLETDGSLPNHIPDQFIEWHQQQMLGEFSSFYSFVAVERYRKLDEYHVVYFPRSLPELLKLALRELGGRPVWLGTLGNALLDSTYAERSLYIFDKVHGYSLYGAGPEGTYLTDLRFQSGVPKFSNWTGDPQIRDAMFDPDVIDFNANVTFVGDFSETKKEHWATLERFTENKPANSLTRKGISLPDEIDAETYAILEHIIAGVGSQRSANLFNMNAHHSVPAEPAPTPEISEIPRKSRYSTTKPAKPAYDFRLPSVWIAMLVILVFFGLIYLNYPRPEKITESLPSIKVATQIETVHIAEVPAINLESAANIDFMAQLFSGDFDSLLNYGNVFNGEVSLIWQGNNHHEIPVSGSLQITEYDSLLNMTRYVYYLSIDSTAGNMNPNLEPTVWVESLKTEFPDAVTNFYGLMTIAGETYLPVTIRVVDRDENVRFSFWAKNGPGNLAVRKIQLHRDSQQHLIGDYYIALQSSAEK